jgi:S1-C subfamily serine protease
MLLAACGQTVDTLPADAVRVVAVEDTKFCSAVVIAPGVALTAGHCLQRNLTVDGLKVDVVVTAPDGKDIAVLRVPGLECPCAERGVRPAQGDKVLAIGFPVDREGNRIVSPEAGVQAVGALRLVAPSFPPSPHADEDYIRTDAAIIDHGDSGGGLFARQNGVWKVVGINALGIPEGPCTMFSCGKEVGSAFVPVDVADKFL